MNKLAIGVLLIVTAMTTVAASTSETLQPNDTIFEACEVFAEKEVWLSAEEAGVLVNLVTDGSTARAGDLLAQIDDRQPQFQMQAARNGFDAANERFMSPIEINYAKAASEVAHTGYLMLLDANKRTSGAVAPIEIEKARLEWKTTELQIEKAEHDKKIAGFEMNVKAAEYELGRLAVDRRSLEAPFDGVVVELRRHQHEWVNPGDPILHFKRLNTMRVEKRISQDDYDPQEIAGKRVTVVVKLARPRTETFTGRITYVSPQLDLDNTFLVRAEVENRQEGGYWLLRPNSQASMTIHLGPTPTTAGGRRGQQ
jgi:multidrug efflux pump subunit AcrA (membrane-fusion protein)